MAPVEDGWSRFVALAKVLLPLLALMLLSVLFLFARRPDPEPDLPYAEAEALAAEPRIVGPSYAGTARNGAVISLRAEEIAPIAGRDGAFRATALRGEVAMPDGRQVELQSGGAEFDEAARAARLSGLSRVVTSDGYEIEARAVEADLDAGVITVPGPLEARAPFGELTAGGLRLEDAQSGAGLVFTGGVRLLYDPGAHDRSRP